MLHNLLTVGINGKTSGGLNTSASNCMSLKVCLMGCFCLCSIKTFPFASDNDYHLFPNDEEQFCHKIGSGVIECASLKLNVKILNDL